MTLVTGLKFIPAQVKACACGGDHWIGYSLGIILFTTAWVQEWAA
jgi:hypothetical protein